jgi:cyclophilin family peptidyl-prolyl cis-trans isomerase
VPRVGVQGPVFIEVQPMSSSSRMPRAQVLFALTLAAAGIAPVLPALGAEGSKIYVHIETPSRFSYSGDPTQVSILIKNEGSAEWTNPGVDLEGGFQVFDSDGKKMEKTKAAATARDAQPKILEPNAYFGKIVNLNTLFPKIGGLGTYRITWSAPGLPDQTIVTKIIKKYDASRDYQGVIETEFGRVVLEFYKDLAPFHVKNFIDLANQGFYDGLLFHRIIKGEVAFGGSPTGDEHGSPGYTVSPEPNGLKVLAGSMAQVRNVQTGPDESGSIFLIAATPQADLDNRVTVFARVVEGLETVKAITNLPTVGGPPRAASRPIKDVVIKKIEIREKKPAKAT